jgi:hypothetical protein
MEYHLLNSDSKDPLQWEKVPEKYHADNRYRSKSIMDSVPWSFRRVLAVLIAGNLLLLSGILGTSIYTSLGMRGLYLARHPAPDLTQTSPPKFLDTCGDTPAIARENDCLFDVMLSSWLPRPCFRPEILAQTLLEHNFTYFLDQELTLPVETEPVLTGDYPQAQVYTQAEFHNAHCSYVWMRQAASLNGEEGGWLDQKSFSKEHTEHCVKQMNEQNSPFLFTSTRITLSYAKCYKIQW